MCKTDTQEVITQKSEAGSKITTYRPVIRSPERNDDAAIRLAVVGVEDFEVVATLFEALHRYNASLNERFALAPDWRSTFAGYFQRSSQSTNTLWLLAWSDSMPVGLLILEHHLDSPLFLHRRRIELVALYVVPEMRGGKVARLLMHKAITWTKQHGEHDMQLYVTAQNERARTFYRRCGWRPAQEIWHLEIKAPALRSTQSDIPTDHSLDQDILEHGHHHVALQKQKHITTSE